MKKNFLIALWMTLVTTVLLGLIYPLVVTGLAQLIFPRQANGELIHANGKSSAPGFSASHFPRRLFCIRAHPPLAPQATIPRNPAVRIMRPTNKALARSRRRRRREAPSAKSQRPIPVDLVTASGFGPRSGHLSRICGIPGSARGPRARHGRNRIRALVRTHTEGRQFGFLGEPRVNVLELNLDLTLIIQFTKCGLLGGIAACARPHAGRELPWSLQVQRDTVRRLPLRTLAIIL